MCRSRLPRFWYRSWAEMWPGSGFLQAFQVGLTHFQGWTPPMFKKKKRKQEWTFINLNYLIKIKAPREDLHKLQTLLFSARETYSVAAVQSWGLLTYQPMLLPFKSTIWLLLRQAAPRGGPGKVWEPPSPSGPAPAPAAGRSLSALNVSVVCICTMKVNYICNL